MTKTPLTTKKERLSAQQERLKKQQQLLKIQERKQRTKKLIELGGLIAKADLSHLSQDELLGALISLKPLAKDAKQRAAWVASTKGHLKTVPAEPATPIAITFSKPPSQDTKAELKKLKFHWNRFRNEWQGYGDVDFIKKQIKSEDVHVVQLKK